MAELEHEVLSLSRAVRSIQAELKLDTNAPPLPSLHRNATPASLLNGDDQESADEEDFFERDELLINDGNSRMRNLFHNELLSTNPMRDQEPRSAEHNGTAQLLDKARSRLQDLIPPKDVVNELSRHVSSWTNLASEMFPPLSTTLMTMSPSMQNLVSLYEQVQRGDTDTWTLAMWLLSLALTAQQRTQSQDQPHKIVQDMTRRYAFAGAVANAVERTLLSHDGLLATIQGLEVSLQFLRL